MRRAIEVHVDGSLKGVAGWGAVIAEGERSLGEFSGELRITTTSSTLCEAQAAANAIHAGLKAGLIRRDDLVTIWADNQSAVDLLAGVTFKRRSTMRRPDYGRVRAWIARVSAEHGIAITARWIKGHQGDAAARTDHRVRFNRRADRLCGIVTGKHRDPAEAKRAEEAHRRAVIRGQAIKAENAARKVAAERSTRIRAAIAQADRLEGRA